MKVSYQFCNYKNHKTFSELRKDLDVQEFVGEPPSFVVYLSSTYVAQIIARILSKSKTNPR
jgi:hypothetical protein